MNNVPRTLVMLSAGVVLLMAATLTADVMLSNSAIRVVGPGTPPYEDVLRAEVTGDNAESAAIRGHAPTTGVAVRGTSPGGIGVFGESTNRMGVAGESYYGSGGSFLSTESYGVWAKSNGANHWNHGVFGSAIYGNGVYGTSMFNEGVRGEGENTGVRGIGSLVGVSGSSASGDGVYGYSSSGNGVYGYSSEGHGVKGHSSGGLSDYGGYFTSSYSRGMWVQGAATRWDAYFGGDTGIYVADDIVAGGSKAGYVVDLARNEGPDPLQLGDVVVITGATDAVLGEIPVPTVRLADSSASTAVLGVVDRMFATPADVASIPERLIGAWQELTRTLSNGEQPMESGAEVESVLTEPTTKQEPPVPTAESPGRFVSQAEAEFLAMAAGGDPGIAPGAYVGVVTLGAFKAIKVDASHGSILPGDLLVSSPTPGHAMRGADPRVGTVIGKALGSLEEGRGSIPVLITLD